MTWWLIVAVLLAGCATVTVGGQPGRDCQTYGVVPTGVDARQPAAHCHLGRGKLYGRTGKGDQAREHLTTATTMYGEMSMTYWLEKAEAEMRHLA